MAQKRKVEKLGLLALFMLIVVSSAVCAQEKKSKQELRQEQNDRVKNLVEAQDYVFVAQQALPMSSKSVHLTSGYDLRVSRDTIAAYLPFYGRAYVAPLDMSESGIKFESRDFTYSLKNTKKGGWIAHIIIKDAGRNIKLILNIAADGSANLLVSDDSRRNISFYGNIEEREK